MMKGMLLGAVIISVLSPGILFLWDTKIIANNALAKLIPAPLLVVLLAVELNEFFKSAVPSFALAASHPVALPELSGLGSLIRELRFPDVSSISNPDVWLVVATIAVVGSPETLLSLDASDKIDPQKRISSPDKELKAQGWGNMLAGLIGGLPMTAVIVRSSANVNAGAKGKFSAIFHGILLLLSALFFCTLLKLYSVGRISRLANTCRAETQ